MNLRAFKGEQVSDFNDENEKTFQKEDRKEWRADIANMSTHTAYCTGPVIYIRKQNGW